MVLDDRRLGAHLPLGGGMLRAADRAGAIGATAIQVFSDNPTAWRRRTEPPAELPAFRARLTELDVAPTVVHASYLVNLAGSDDVFRDRSIGVLASDLRSADTYGARILNVHIGSHLGAGVEAGIARLADGVARAFELAGGLTPADRGGPVLALENSAGGGFGLGASIEELEQILVAIVGRVPDEARVGFCLDTAHLWGAGFRIDHADGVDALLAEVGSRLGRDRLAVIHLNDSRAEPGSRSDRHEHIGAGRIGAEGLRAVLVHPWLAGMTYILETPGMDEGYDAINIARARDLVAGRALADLPPEAFTLRARHGRSAPPDEDRPRVDESRPSRAAAP